MLFIGQNTSVCEIAVTDLSISAPAGSVPRQSVQRHIFTLKAFWRSFPIILYSWDVKPEN